MKKHTCIIIDDEELARELLENFINRVPDLQLLGKFINPIDALSFLNEQSVDLIFLDIQMPGMTGIEFLKSLTNPPLVIFTTAYDRYAVEGYELSVIDYLLKPFSFARTLTAINKAVEQITLRQKEIKPYPPDQDYLLVNADHKVHRLPIKDILYVQSMREYVVYYSENNKVMALGSLKKVEEKLLVFGFIRIHKSFIVAKNRVKSLEGNQLDIGVKKLPIGGSYKNDVKASLFSDHS